MLHNLIDYFHARAAAAVALFTSVSLVFGQTKIVAPENKYKPAGRRKAGREAARRSSNSFRSFGMTASTSYVERIGQRLAEAIPDEFQHPSSATRSTSSTSAT